MSGARAALAAALLLAATTAYAEAPVTVRWLGVAGFSIASGDTVLLHDPFLSRPSLWRTALFRYRPDRELLARLTGPGGAAPEAGRAKLVLIGHSHYDHLGDAPWFAETAGATIVGSETTVAISRGYGVPGDRVQRADVGDTLTQEPFHVRVVESRHAGVVLGKVPLPGEVSEPPDGPIHALSFLLGDARGYLVTHRPTGLRLFFLSSAAVHPPGLDELRREGVRVDVLFAPTQGRSERYAQWLVDLLRPRIVVLHHYESFFVPVDDPEADAPRDPEDLTAFEAEIETAARLVGHDVEVRRLGLFETLEIEPAAAR